ncbi:MAG: tetratricopeptide repeat protein [Chloroflexota bacterium]
MQTILFSALWASVIILGLWIAVRIYQNKALSVPDAIGILAILVTLGLTQLSILNDEPVLVSIASTPLPTATPAPFPLAAEGEALIVIGTFFQESGTVGVAAEQQIFQKINEQINEFGLENIRVEIDPNVSIPFSPNGEREEAKLRLGEPHNATLAIWGQISGVEIKVNFLNLKEPDNRFSDLQLRETEAVELARPDAYKQFVLEGLPSQLGYLSFVALGLTEMAEEDFDSAITLIERGISLLDESQRNNKVLNLEGTYFSLGLLFQSTGEYDQAIANYDQVIKIDPQDAGAFNNRGNAYARKGDLDQAIADYDQAIALDPQYAFSFNNRGLAYSDKGDLDQAIADLNQAIALDPQLDGAFFNRGNAYSRKGDLDQAIADLNQAIALEPQFYIAFNNRGLAYSRKGDLDQAIASYDQAIALEPQFYVAFINRGFAYSNKGDLNRAIADYDQAIALDPQNTFAFTNRGLAYSNKGDLNRAIGDYNLAILLDPQNEAAFLNRGNAYYYRGDLYRALIDWKKYLELAPDAPNSSRVEALINEIENR